MLNSLSGRFDKLEDKERLRRSLEKFLKRLWESGEGVIRDIFLETGWAVTDATDLGLSNMRLEDLFKALSNLEKRYTTQLEAMLSEIRSLPREIIEDFTELGVVLRESVEDLLKVLHLIYLHSGDRWFLHLAAILYAESKSKGAVKLYCAAALARLLSGRDEEALALAAYASELRVKKPSVEPWREPGKWARALAASYHLDVGVSVVRELLAEYNFREAFRER